MLKSVVKHEDLFIGSYVAYDGDREVDSIIRNADGSFSVRLAFKRPSGMSDVLEVPLWRCHPIATTETWLEKLGFSSVGYKCPEYGTESKFPYRTEWKNSMCIEIEEDFSACIYDKSSGTESLGVVPLKLYTEVHLLQKLLKSLS